MPFFIEYHDVELLNYLPLEWRPLRPLAPPRTIASPVGGTVFLVAGVGMPKRYHVWESYRIRAAEPHEEGVYLLREDRAIFSPPIRLSGPLLAAVLAGKMEGDFWSLDDAKGLELRKHLTQEDAVGDTDVDAEERFWTEVIADRPEDADPYGLRAELRRQRGATDLEVEDLRNYKHYRTFVPGGVRRLGGEPIVRGQTKKERTSAGSVGSLWAARQKIAKRPGRPGQGKFRKEVLEMFGGQCIVTGCAIGHVVQAAHLVPYGASRLQKVYNGIALRADLHVLFDLHLLRINSQTKRLSLQHDLEDTEYKYLDRQPLTFPAKLAAMPEFQEALNHRWRIANATPDEDRKE